MSEAERKDTPQQAEFRAYCQQWLRNNHPGRPDVKLPQGALELSDPDALAWLQDSEVSTAAEAALTQADDEVFQAGLRAARTLPERDAERLLARGLSHSGWHVRMLAIKLLLELGTDRSRTLLTDALENETDAMVRHAIESGLPVEV